MFSYFLSQMCTGNVIGTETVVTYSFLEKYGMFPCSFHYDFRDWVLLASK